MGRSACVLPGVRCHFNRFDDLVDESLSYVKTIVKEEVALKDLPVFLFGLSMGGATAIRLSEEASSLFAGMVLFAPMISLEKVREQPIFHCIKNRTVEPLIGVLSRLFPTKPLAKLTPNTMFPMMQAEYANDPLCHNADTRILVAKNMIDTTARFMAPNGFDRVTVPFAVYHSVHDTLTDLEGTEALYGRTKNVREGDKSFFRVGIGLDVDVKLWHNLLREPGAETVMTHAMEWIEKRGKGQKEGKVAPTTTEPPTTTETKAAETPAAAAETPAATAETPAATAETPAAPAETTATTATGLDVEAVRIDVAAETETTATTETAAATGVDVEAVQIEMKEGP